MTADPIPTERDRIRGKWFRVLDPENGDKNPRSTIIPKVVDPEC